MSQIILIAFKVDPMPQLLLKPHIHSWLYSLGLVSNLQCEGNGIPSDQLGLWQVGKSFGTLILTLATPLKLSPFALENLLKLKHTNTLPVRLFNWNILNRVLEEVGISLKTETKKEIIDGNYHYLPTLVECIYALSEGEFFPDEQELSESIVRLGSIESVEEIPVQQRFQTATDFLIVSLSNAMSLAKENTVYLLQNNNRLLNHILISGDQHASMISFLNQIQEKIQETSYVIQDSYNINVFCNTFREGLVSKDHEIFSRCLGIYRKALFSSRRIKDWINNFALGYLIGIGLHQPDRASQIVRFLLEVLDSELFQTTRPNTISQLNLESNQEPLIPLMLLECMEETVLNKYLESPCFIQWLTLLLDNIKFQKQTYPTIQILLTLWLRSPIFFTSHKLELPILYVDYLKQIAMSSSTIESCAAIAVLFTLIDKLGAERNLYAPHVYKAVCSMLELMEVNSRMLDILDHLMASFQELPTLPVEPVILVLLRVMELGPTPKLAQFLVGLVSESRLKQEDASRVLKSMIKSSLSNIHHSSYLLKFISSLWEYFEQDQLNELVTQSFKVCLSIFHQLHMQHPQWMPGLGQTHNQIHTTEEAEAYSKTVSVYRLMRLWVAMSADKEAITAFTCETCKSLRGKLSCESKLLMDLLREMHSETSINEMMDEGNIELQEATNIPISQHQQYSQDQNNDNQQGGRQRSRNESWEQNEEGKEEEEEMEQESQEEDQEGGGKQGREEVDEESYSDKQYPVIYTESIMPIEEQSSETQSQYFGSPHPKPTREVLNIFPTTPSIPVSHTTPTHKAYFSISIRPSPAVLQSIEDVRSRRLFRLLSQQEREKDFKKSEERKIKRAQKLVHRRQIQFGVSRDPDCETECLFEWNTLKEPTVTEIGLSDIQLIEWEDEEDQNASAASALMKKYRKLWRLLFLRFQTSGAAKMAKGVREEKITIAEIWKLLKSYNLPLLRREEMSTFVRLINESKGRRDNLQILIYSDFEEFIIQYATHCYKSKGIVCSTPSHAVLRLIDDMKTTAFLKGDSTSIFQTPENVYFQEGEVVSEFNRRLGQNPDYILPDGYKKIKETNIRFSNKILLSNTQTLPASFVTASEVLSQLLESIFHCTFIEYSVQSSSTFRAKPILFQGIGQKLKQHTKGYLEPRRQKTESLDVQRIRQIDKTEFHPLVKFSLGIKIGMSYVTTTHKYIAEEVAYLMNDVLDAIQNQRDTVTDLSKVHIVNPRMRELQARKEQDKIRESERNRKLIKRTKTIKSTLERQKEMVNETKLQRLRMSTLLAEEEKVREVSKDKRYSLIREKVKQKKLQDDEDNRMQRDTELRLKKVRQRERYRSVKEFIDKEKESLKVFEEQVRKKKEREEGIRKEESEKTSPDKQVKLYLNILKNDEHVLQKASILKKMYCEAWKSEQIQSVACRYQLELRLLFDLLLKSQNSKITTFSSKKISPVTFNHFCLKFKITPKLINKSNVASIFNSLLKETSDHEGLDFRMFQQAVFKVCVRGKEFLNSPDPNATVKQQRDDLRFVRRHKNVSVADQYLFDIRGVSDSTFCNLFEYLNLPSDRIGMEIRYRKAVETH